MATTDKWGQAVSAPTLSDEPNIEALIATVNALASPGILKFQNATARAAYIPTPVHGMLVDLVDEDRIDRWDGTRWYPITPGPWHAFPYGSGMVADAGSPGYRFCNGRVELRGRIRRSGNGQFTTGTDWVLGTMPAGWRVDATRYFTDAVEIGASIYVGRGEFQTDGRIIHNTPPGSTSTSNGLHWVSLDDMSYPLGTPPATL